MTSGQPQPTTLPSVGELLHELRTRQGLSLRELARQSGVAQPTLSRWEQNRFQPRLPELEAVLNALHATPQQRRTFLERLDAPRAQVRLAEAAPHGMAMANSSETAPHGGDLLRALRLRAGRTSEESARSANVSTTTLWRWERGETWPDSAQLQTLCKLLAASQEEYEALVGGRYSLATPRAAALSLDALEHIFRTELEPIEMAAELNAGRDLHFLRLEAALWKRATSHSHARLLLAEVCAHHASYLSNFRRNPSPYLQHALELGQELRNEIKDTWHWLDIAVVREADRVVWRQAGRRPAAGLEMLRLWRRLEFDAEADPWALRKAAGYYTMAGDHAAARAIIERLYAHPRVLESAWEQREAGRTAAEALLGARRYGAALERLVQEDAYPPNRLRDALLRARAEHGLGNREYAQNWLAQADAMRAQFGLEHLRREAETVAALTQSGPLRIIKQERFA